METSNQVNTQGDRSSSTAPLSQRVVSPPMIRELMIASGESRKEACGRKYVFAKPKAKKRIAHWNVRTLYEDGKVEMLIREAKKYKLSVLGLSEVRWLGSGKEVLGNDMTMYYSGKSEGSVHEYGVGFLLDAETSRAVLEWKPVSDRIITLRLNSNHIKTTFIQVYAPHDSLDEESKDAFYNSLQEVIKNTPRHDMVMVMGDLNAKIGYQKEGEERSVGAHALTAERNDNGERYVNFCLQNDLVITSTTFCQPDIHKYTWTSPDRRTKNQIDHLAICGKFRSSVLNTRTYRGADVNSDHELCVSTVQLKLRKVIKTNNTKKRYDFNKLKSPDTKQMYNLELKNRFDALIGLNDDAEDQVDNPMSCKDLWTGIRDTYNKVSEEVLGFKRKGHKDWVSPSSWTKINERAKIKAKRDSARSQRLRNKIQKEYSAKDREVKKSVRLDKRYWVENIARNAEEAAAVGNMKAVYDATRTLCGQKHRNMELVKDKDGNKLTNANDIQQRWKEHFEEVLNRPEPTRKLHINEAVVENREIDSNHPSEIEIRKAFKQTRGGKGGPVDGMVAEMIHSDIDTAVKVFSKLYKKVWDEEYIPEDWKKGLIAKIPKKGDLTKCGNWRGITLNSVAAKILGRILINRIKDGTDRKLRKEQTGFRKGKGTSEQIFILRNILEQSVEWNTNLYLCFVDFEKAFDSVHRETLWKLMAHYGIPKKLINLVKKWYDKSRCAVIDGSGTSDWFSVISGVKQGCTMSGFLFLLVIDYVMRTTTEGASNGIRWKFTEKLEDLDYADDLALLSSSASQCQRKINKLKATAEKAGLKINTDKTKSMRINARTQTPLKIGNEDMEDVVQFVYLGSVMTVSGDSDQDVKVRIGKAWGAYNKLKPIWNSKQLSTKTKVRVYRACVISVLLYGCESWGMTKCVEEMLEKFFHKSLRMLLNVNWTMFVSNVEVRRRANLELISQTVKMRRWKWIGHVLRMDRTEHARIAVTWKPDGRRKAGRPKTTWRRMVEKEMKTMGIRSWEDAARVAKDRALWRNLTSGPILPMERRI